MNCNLVVQYASTSTDIPVRSQFCKWVSATLTQYAEITLRIVDEPEGRHLNKQFRGKNSATNVLTFVYDEMEQLSGDIVLCTTIIEKEARQQQKKIAAHYAHLTVHGILHLQGYDHENETDATAMEELEIKIITSFGFNAPY